MIFTATVFPRDWFLDTSDESPLETMRRFTSGARSGASQIP